MEPNRFRAQWNYWIRCPVCGNAQNGRRSDLGKVTGERKLQCGHHVRVKVARTLAQDPSYATAGNGQLTLWDQQAA